MKSADSKGSVCLVGAGPGDAELLTIKAVKALQSADVILFDDLVSDEVLSFARREAKRMLVGKRAGRDSCKQEYINDIMVRLARAGKHVVRLKSGDPMVFGRAGEEIKALRDLGIAVTVIPGISAASGMASELGVSLTHRDHAQAVRFVTGHSRHGVLPVDIDWKAVADRRTTAVFYMGARTAGQIADALIAHGLPDTWPAVVCRSATRSSRAYWAGPLHGLASGVAELGLDQPVLIGIGGVFADIASDQLSNWIVSGVRGPCSLSAESVWLASQTAQVRRVQGAR